MCRLTQFGFRTITFFNFLIILNCEASRELGPMVWQLQQEGFKSVEVISHSDESVVCSVISSTGKLQIIKIRLRRAAGVTEEAKIQNDVYRQAVAEGSEKHFLPARLIKSKMPDCAELLASSLATRNRQTSNRALNLYEHQAENFRRISHISRENLVLQIIDAVSTTHRAGWVHRDLKPANILIDEYGVVKIIDWGLSGRPGEFGENCRASVFSGNLGYCSPNQMRLEPPEFGDDLHALRSILAWDVYAFGVPTTKDYLIDREFAYDVDTMKLITRRVHTVAPELPTIGSVRFAVALWSRLPATTTQLRDLAFHALIMNERAFLIYYGELIQTFIATCGFQGTPCEREEDEQTILDFVSYDILGSRLLSSNYSLGLGLPREVANRIRESGINLFKKVERDEVGFEFAPRVGPHRQLHFSEFFIAHRTN